MSVALAMEVFNGILYVGTRNDNLGAEVWRYDGGTTWTQVNQDGFGGSSSKAIWDLTEYNNSLYAGTMTGGQLWRYDSGTAWTQVNENGFGDAANSMVTSMTVLGGKLCAGTDNRTDYCQIWATGNAPIPTPSATPASLILDSGDYDGDSTSDIGIFRESTGLWAIRGITRAYYGGGDDRPVPGNYNGFIPDGIGIFRDNTGLWAIKDITRIYFGASSDLPVSGPAINPSSAATP